MLFAINLVMTQGIFSSSVPQDVQFSISITTAGAILLSSSIVVAIMSFIQKRRGLDARSVWVKYGMWYIMVPLIFGSIFDRITFQIVIFLISVLGFLEYARATGISKDLLLLCVSFMAIGFVFLTVIASCYEIHQLMPLCAVLSVLLVPIFRRDYKGMGVKCSMAIFGIIYFGWFVSYFALMRNSSNGILYASFFLILVAVNDAMAYMVGSLIGRHKLIPQLSPNKTCEGALGAVALCIVLGLMLHRILIPDFAIEFVVLISYVLSVGGLCGDLILSFIKRDLGVKDLANVIPGHGGITDRINSIAFTAPIFLLLTNYFYGVL